MTSSRIVHDDPAVGDLVPALEPRSSDRARSSSRSPSTWRSRCRPCSFSSPQAKQWCGSNAKRPRDRRDARRVPARPAARRPQTSRFRTLRASALMKSLRGSTFSPMSFVKIVVGLAGVVDLDPQERPRLRVHRRLPELVGVHLAEALEALDGEVLAVHLLDDPVALLLGLGVLGDLAGARRGTAAAGRCTGSRPR